MTFQNQLKTTLFLIILTLFVLAIGFLLGGQTGLTIAFIIALLLNFISYFYSDKIVLKIYKAKLASHQENEELHEMVQELALKASIKKPKIYIIPSQTPNAFATGRNPKHSAVAVTQGILNQLTKRELKGVLAHEIAHIKNRDILISTIASVLAGTIAYVASMARFAAIFGGRDDGVSIIEVIVISILAPLIALILQLSISRSREFLADHTGAKLTKDPNSLADALISISNSPSKMNFGTEATSSMFILNPFKKRGISKLFSTHPPTEERVKKLRNMIV